MKAQAIEKYEAEGADAAVAFLQQAKVDASPTEHVHLFRDVMRHAYWEKKDLPSAIQLGQDGIMFGEQLLEKHPDLEAEIKGKIKGLYYDIASFTWPGWDEEGIEINDEQVRLGLQAAKHNLKLAKELRKDPLPCSRAYWLLAAQEVAARQYEQAKRDFKQAESLAREAELEAEALLAEGFIVVIGLLEEPGNQVLTARLEEIRAKLQQIEQGKFFIAQLFDSLRVFKSQPG